MKSLVLAACLLLGVGLTEAHAFSLYWNRNTESDMKGYHVYVHRTQGCTATDIGADWFAFVPQPAVGVEPSVPLPDNIQGCTVVTAENTSGLFSLPSESLQFSTMLPVVHTPPSPPSGLSVR